MKKIFGLFLLIAIINTQIQAGDNVVALVSSTTPDAVILGSLSAIGFIGAAGCWWAAKNSFKQLTQKEQEDLIKKERAIYDEKEKSDPKIYQQLTKQMMTYSHAPDAPALYKIQLDNRKSLVELHVLIQKYNSNPGLESNDASRCLELASKIGQKDPNGDVGATVERVERHIKNIRTRDGFKFRHLNDSGMLSSLVEETKDNILSEVIQKNRCTQNATWRARMEQASKYSLGIGIVAALGLGLLKSMNAR